MQQQVTSAITQLLGHEVPKPSRAMVLSDEALKTAALLYTKDPKRSKSLVIDAAGFSWDQRIKVQAVLQQSCFLEASHKMSINKAAI
jgi:hypothetical protein